MADFIKRSAVKAHISSLKKTRISKTALNKLIRKLNSLTRTLIKESRDLARKDKRSTIMPRDMAEAIEKTVGRKHLTWQEVAKQITRLGPIELGNISKAIDQHIEKQKR